MNAGIILILAIAGIWVLGIFFGVIGGLSKTFHQTPTVVDSSSLKSQAHQTIQDTEEKRQQLMDDMKQKMQDASQHR